MGIFRPEAIMTLLKDREKEGEFDRKVSDFIVCLRMPSKSVKSSPAVTQVREEFHILHETHQDHCHLEPRLGRALGKKA